ncbi:MAG TPA: PadR family transcriptional regulator [Solirubrobacterales bacterium]|jgi:DNA-binding PadR family transcriptional regulator|nr:PadR family transcriptional regulator [Solirubrobacterales bacterium]
MKSKSIRLTGNSYAVLALIAEFGDSTSYEIKQWLERSIQNFWPVPHTTAYEEPARLTEGGYLSARQEEGGRRRRIYSLTEKGREALAAWAREPTASPPQLRDEVLLKVFAGADPAPLREERTAWHEAKREELQGYLDAVRQVEGYEDSERTLRAGILYHEMMLEVLGRLGGE